VGAGWRLKAVYVVQLLRTLRYHITEAMTQDDGEYLASKEIRKVPTEVSKAPVAVAVKSLSECWL